MTIELITPPPRSTIPAGSSISFDVDDGYTSMLIEVDADGGTETAYDGTSGGAQSGYTCSVVTDGTTHTFTLKRDAGWDTSPQLIRVTENESGDSTVTEFSYELVGSSNFPQPVRPVDPEDFPKMRITMSGDSTEDVLEVEWIDVVSGTPPDGMDVTNPAEEKARLEALASTTDPDAIHDNVANEVSAITEKLATNNTEDMLIMEDSEAGYVKKKVLARKFAGTRLPTKLDNDLSCQFLYLMNEPAGAVHINTGTAGTYWNLARQGGVQAICPSIAKEERDTWYENNTITSTFTLTSTADTAASGEVTVQCVFRCGDASRTANNGRLFGMNRANSQGLKACWILRFYDDGSPTGAPCVPEFFYRDAADAVSIRARDDDFRIMEGINYHVAGRRMDDGAGGYDVSLWVNGLKIAQVDSQVAGFGTDTGHKVAVGGEVGNDGQDRTQICCAKMSNTALTDEQIVGEYKKALGIE